MSFTSIARASRAVGADVPLLVALFSSAWLVGSTVLHRAVPEGVGELGFFGFVFLAVPVFAGSCLLSMFSLVLQCAPGPWELQGDEELPTAGSRSAALPLAVNALALVIFVLAPLLAPAVDWLDFRVHQAARSELVARVEAGELRRLWPSGSLGQVSSAGADWPSGSAPASLPLPPEYPSAVSDGGYRMLFVYREQGALHVVFFPRLSLRGPHTLFVYRADGRKPSLPYFNWKTVAVTEPLADRWFRLVLE
jgi:hypothetical protein